MDDHHEAETMSIEGLIRLQRMLARSRNPFERVVASFCVAGLLRQRLGALPNQAVGQLMFDCVWNELNLLSPEMAICSEATERLLEHELGANDNQNLGTSVHREPEGRRATRD